MPKVFSRHLPLINFLAKAVETSCLCFEGENASGSDDDALCAVVVQKAAFLGYFFMTVSDKFCAFSYLQFPPPPPARTIKGTSTNVYFQTSWQRVEKGLLWHRPLSSMMSFS